MKNICILEKHTVHVVWNHTREMINAETQMRIQSLDMRADKIRMVLMLSTDLSQHTFVASFRNANLFIQHVEYPSWSIEKTKHSCIILEINCRHLNTLSKIFLLLQLENVFVEETLKNLVTIVNAELLEAVVLEDLEAKDVEYADDPLVATA